MSAHLDNILLTKAVQHVVLAHFGMVLIANNALQTVRPVQTLQEFAKVVIMV